jgi:D-amino-acid oxidase
MFQPSLTLWRDLIPLPRRLREPAANAAHVLVIGGGVTGLITSWVLLDQGYHVTIISKNWANASKDSRLTSQIAGALWEYPPAVCGLRTLCRINLCSKKPIG